ncbi:formimidoylglutamase [Kocuria rhizophila]|uniref:formimidoylglutamase n=1 Tax=Kocuria rhizophila TaxID=72000 RepID=UPI0022EFDC5B|nr:formimidoylglutamase [Kocuria rhizophila]MDA4827519.1 formimidoylglutamase [Kocuria rhizophila]
MTTTRITPPDPPVWSGRTDGDTPEHLRWHQRARQGIAHEAAQQTPQNASRGDGQRGADQDTAAQTAPTAQTAQTPAVELIGFSCDEGVRRNKGRVGASEGPDALRGALAPLAMHADFGIHDAGTVVVPDRDLEGGQDTLGNEVARLLDTGNPVVVLGGGHDTAWGSYLGRTRCEHLRDQRVGVLNLDAHFDLRQADEPSSGTPFLQMARADREAGRTFDYTVLGISEPNNTGVLFRTADELGVEHLTDEQCQPRHLDAVLEVVDRLVGRVDAIHLSIDLDVLPAAVAPGVSAPAGYGVPLETIQAVCHRVARSGKLVLVDVVELLPRMDVDGRTARAAARLITTLAHDALITTTPHLATAGTSPHAGGAGTTSSTEAAPAAPTPPTGPAGNTTGERHE